MPTPIPPTATSVSTTTATISETNNLVIPLPKVSDIQQFSFLLLCGSAFILKWLLQTGKLSSVAEVLEKETKERKEDKEKVIEEGLGEELKTDKKTDMSDNVFTTLSNQKLSSISSQLEIVAISLCALGENVKQLKADAITLSNKLDTELETMESSSINISKVVSNRVTKLEQTVPALAEELRLVTTLVIEAINNYPELEGERKES